MRAKREKPFHLDTDFDEALRRFIQVDPDELRSDVEKIRERQEKIRENAKKIKERIRKGA